MTNITGRLPLALSLRAYYVSQYLVSEAPYAVRHELVSSQPFEDSLPQGAGNESAPVSIPN